MGPLTGLRVLDLTGMASGPVAAMMLAVDQGAEVIKVEPLTGELVRHMAAPHNGVNPVFFSCNLRKKINSFRSENRRRQKNITQTSL